MGSLVEAVKMQAARARIPYDSERVYDAVLLVARNRGGVLTAPAVRPALVVQPEFRPFTRAEAADLCRRLKVLIR